MMTMSSPSNITSIVQKMQTRVIPSLMSIHHQVPDKLLKWQICTRPNDRRTELKMKRTSDFQTGRGHVIDVLRESYPQLFTERPDMSIYSREIKFYRAATTVSDEVEPTLIGIDAYRRLFDAMRLTRRTTCTDAQLTYRLHVMDDTIRVSWAARLWLRRPLLPFIGSLALPLHIDAVSVYILGTHNLHRAAYFIA